MSFKMRKSTIKIYRHPANFNYFYSIRILKENFKKLKKIKERKKC
jgi:hypothetical protein